MKLAFSKQLSGRPNVLLAAAVVLVGLAGSYQVSRSSAATDNQVHPYGYLDSCELIGTSTIIYGWAQDPDAPKGPQPTVNVKVGAQTRTVQTDIVGYRDGAINDYIRARYPGQPTPGEYGFKVKLDGLYKGGNYSISGLALNYGAGNGQDTALTVYGSVFVSGKVPDSCLAPKPKPAAPPSPPVVTPPSGGNDSSPAANDSSSLFDISGDSDTSLPLEPTNATDTTVSTGTTSASIKAPVDNAAQIHVVYGTDVNTLSSATDDQIITDTTDAPVTIAIDGLDALTTYHYAIVRTGADGTITTSAPADFKTQGYTISLHFVDGNKKAVADIKGALDDAKKTKATSDKGGAMTFNNMPSGTYVLTYSYQGKTRKQDLDTSTAEVKSTSTVAGQEDTPQVAVLSATIDLSKASANLGVGAGQGSSGGKAAAVIISIISLLLLGFGLWFWRRRRQRSAKSGILPAPYNPLLSGQDIIDHRMNQHFETHKPEPQQAPQVMFTQAPVTQPTSVNPQPSHMGESLREMVIKSMHEEALKKKQPPPKSPS